jgi:ribosomal protein S18 acetylase RimI-like enzyme
MSDSLIYIRKPILTDLLYLNDVDLKAYEDPLGPEEWQNVLQDQSYLKLLAVAPQYPMGFVVWRLVYDTAEITRLGVKPCARNQGVGSELLKAVEISASAAVLKYVTLVVSETFCYGSDSLVPWLKKRGYHYLDVLHGEGYFCGQPEDAFVFRREL